MDNGFAFLEAQLLQHGIHALGTENAHEVIFKGEIEPGPAGITLTAGTAAELIVDAAAFMALGADDEEAAGGDDLLLVGFDFCGNCGNAPGALGPFGNIGQIRGKAHVEIAAELNVGAAAGHVGGNGHGACNARLGDDGCFLFMVAGVQHIVRHAHGLEHGGQGFGFLNGGCAHQNRLAALAGILDGFDDGGIFFAGRAVDLIVFILAVNGHVGRDVDDLKLVDVHELVGFGGGRAGHARQLFVKPEIILEGDRGERHVFRLDGGVLLGFEGLVQAFRIAPSRHHAPGELVDDDDLIVLDDVVLVALEQLVGAQRLLHVVDDGDVLRVVKIVALQHSGSAKNLLQMFVALFRQGA